MPVSLRRFFGLTFSSYCVYDEVDAKKSNSVDVARMLQPDGKGEYSLWENILVQTVFAGKRTGN